MPSVVQPWVSELSYMMQSVLLTSLRGPDGIHKNHVSKLLIRWLRRCVLISAFDNRPLMTPWEPGGGSFTGPSLPHIGTAHSWEPLMHDVLDKYMSTLDELPHHFQLHFLHAAEILGYFHPDRQIGLWWEAVYRRLCNDMHLNAERLDQLQNRLGDNEANWRAAEEVVAAQPGDDQLIAGSHGRG